VHQSGSPGGAAPPPTTLFTRFRDCALRYPDATAIEVAGETVRYRELLDLSERLASRLVDVAGGRPVAVALLAARSLAAYAGYLAALRLGATVVPLGPGFPVDRNALMCRSCRVDVIVADQAGAGRLGELAAQTGAATVSLRAAGATPWYWTLTDPWSEPYNGTPAEVAYVVFTSGSTGEPKGVPIRHRYFEPYLTYCIDRYAAGPGARLSQAFELTFDASVFDMFVSWCSGATLVVPQPAQLLAPVRFIAGRRLTHWFSVPSVISLARGAGMLPDDSMPELRWSIFGGEQLTHDQARAWAAAAPHSAIDNLYGPTELTVSCAAYRLPADPAHWPATQNGTVPIGQVHPHLEWTVLGEDRLPAAVGELCVRGSQRFEGYLNPAHNPGSFVLPDGSGNVDQRATVGDELVPAGAWYRTGDRVQCTAEGLLTHLGRIDDQLKVRGYRIEPGEIESVLREHPKVLDVVVLAVGATAPTLHAVYTGEPVDAALAAYADGRLPAYLRPEHYRRVEQLPVNTNGKVDRRRLAAELAGPGPAPPPV
jgi:amino acid adenylation domain-containing protein